MLLSSLSIFTQQSKWQLQGNGMNTISKISVFYPYKSITVLKPSLKRMGLDKTQKKYCIFFGGGGSSTSVTLISQFTVAIYYTMIDITISQIKLNLPCLNSTVESER